MTVTEAPSCSRGVSTFVAVTTTGSVCFTSGVCFTSCAAAVLTASARATMVTTVRIMLHSFSAKGLEDSLRAGFLTRGSTRPPTPSHRPLTATVAPAHAGPGRRSPLTVARPCRLLTGFPRTRSGFSRGHASASPPLVRELDDRASARTLVHGDVTAEHAFQQPLLEDVDGGADARDLARAQQQQAVAELGGQVEIVRDEQDRHAALAVQPPQQRRRLGLVAQVEMRGGLVEHEQPRLLGQRPREQRPLALAPRELLERQRSQCERLRRRHGRPRGGDVGGVLEEAARRVRVTAHQHELFDRERKGPRRLLRHHRHLARQRPGREIAHGPSGEPDLAALRAQHAREQPQQRRLARAVGTDDAEDLAALDGERQPRKRERPLAPTRGPRVGEGDVAELNERRQSGRLRVRRIHTKKGAPQKAVITPTESSAGATTLRASVSAASRNAPPASAAVGTRKRLAWPTSRRNTSGTISPTKPMGPVNATTVPVSSAAATNTRRLSRSASTPSWREASSPSASRFSSRALFRISQTPAPARTAKSASEAAGIGPRLPSSQWITPVRRLKSTTEMITVMAAEKKMPTMTPVRSRVWTARPPGAVATR